MLRFHQVHEERAKQNIYHDHDDDDDDDDDDDIYINKFELFVCHPSRQI
jgi:hypothetical protein